MFEVKGELSPSIISYKIKDNKIILKYSNGKIVKLPYDKNSDDITSGLNNRIKELNSNYQNIYENVIGLTSIGVILMLITLLINKLELSMYFILLSIGSIGIGSVLETIISIKQNKLESFLYDFKHANLKDEKENSIKHNITNDKSLEEPIIKLEEDVINKLSLDELYTLKENLNSIENPVVKEKTGYQKTMKPLG